MKPTLSFDRIKDLGSSLTMAQRLSLVGAFVAVVALMTGSAYLMNRQDYVLLFSDLDAESAADVVSRLKAAKVDYQIGDGGRTVRVPEGRADELRLEFASQGLPSAGRIGFEIFDKISFGATEFVEQVNFRRALEGEIARTISTIADISSARVHIAVAKTSLFETREQAAKASVILKLRNNRPLPPTTARAIASLVAASVEGLAPESVVIIDSHGRPLARPGTTQDDATSGPSMERQLSVERDLSVKLVNLLEPVVGTGKVRVNVAVRLNAATEEQTEERWDPTAPVIRSRQTSSDLTPAQAAAAGLAGTRANLPEAVTAATQAAAAGAAAPGAPATTTPDGRVVGRNAETTNYEISHSTRHTIRPNGEVARLSVAVVLDDQTVTSTAKDGAVARKYQPRSAEELQKIQGLVAAAMGIDATRGDQLTVENVAFEDRPSLEEGPAPTFWQQQRIDVVELSKVGAVALLGLLAFFFLVRPVVKRALVVPASALPLALPEAETTPALPTASETPRTVADLEGAIAAQLEAAEVAGSGDRAKIPVLAKRLGTLTAKEPEHAARLIRTWLQEDRAGR